MAAQPSILPTISPWYVSLTSNLAALGLVAMGTTMLLAPWKVVRRIDLFRPSPTSEPMLRFSIRSPLGPLTNFGGGSFEAKLGDVSRDRPIVASALLATKDMREGGFNMETGEFEYRSRKPSAFFFFKRYMEKMVTRDGMAYVKIAGRHGVWKLDLFAYGLERGEPLDRFFTLEPNIGRGIPGLVKRLTLRRNTPS